MSSWHSKTVADAITELNSSPLNGLTDGEAQVRLARYGENKLVEAKRKTLLQRFVDQFKEFLIILLIISALISALFGEYGDAIAIIAIVILNAIMGVVQENKAENALEALKKMTNPKAKAIRNGRVEVVDATKLVPGDIVLLDAGDIIPADMRLIEDASLKIEEAALTGESLPVEKSAELVIKSEVSIGDKRNMAFMGTNVTYGRGKGVITATGMSTEVGRIAQLLHESIEEKTPLQQTLDKLGKMLGIICIVLCIIVFIAGILQGEAPLVMFMTAVSLAVAAIPEGLPAIVTIVLAIGVQRMAKQNAIIRRLPAVETLGSASVICSDKTGTLTSNKMTVRKLYYSSEWVDVSGEGYNPNGEFRKNGIHYSHSDDKTLSELFRCSVLCNDATFERLEDGSTPMIGDPTEGCLLVAAAKAGMWKSELLQSSPRVAEVPFDSVRKRMSTFHGIDGNIRMYTKGAPDELFALATSLLTSEGIIPFGEEEKKALIDANGSMAEGGLRVLAMAYRDVYSLPHRVDPSIETDLTLIGLVGMQDPPRAETAPAVAACHDAGIIPVMITGDHKTTAVSIARQVGIADQDTIALSGVDLDRMQDNELYNTVDKIRVYARVSPEHKMRIIDAWRKRGHIVAMTGDGVNDAPALKKSDIGVAMGITGTDVAKGASDMILTDDNFASIVKAIEEGRTIYNNIRKSVQYLIRCNIGEIVLIFVSIVGGLSRPLLPIQILWVNLVTDSLPALALGVDPPEQGIMKREPRRQKDSILSAALLTRLTIHGIILGLASLASFVIGERLSIGGAGPTMEAARTMCLLTLTFGQLFTSLSVSCSETSIFSRGAIRNKVLIQAILLSSAIQLAVVYVPYIRDFLKLVPISIGQMGIALGLAALMVPVAEVLKMARKLKK